MIVPVKNSGHVVPELVASLLAQDYRGAFEIILVGDPDDTSWDALHGEIDAGRIVAIAASIDCLGRDTNAKRQIGLQHARGDVFAFTDSDMVLPKDWLSRGVVRLSEGYQAVAGSMIAIDDGFWGNYVDGNPIGGKTPRMRENYLLTTENVASRKLPVTANFFCTRQVYEMVDGPDGSFVHTYDDYEWFSRMLRAGIPIYCDQDLPGHHHHRQGFRALIGEYRNSGWGCADFIVAHLPCPFARRRLKQLAAVTLAPLAVVALVVLVAAMSLSLTQALLIAVATGAAGVAALCLFSGLKAHRWQALGYPFVTFVLGMAFVWAAWGRFTYRGWALAPQPTIRSVSVLCQEGS